MVSPRTLFGAEGDVLNERQFQLLLLAFPVIAFGVALISPILESLTGPFGVDSIAIGQMVSVYVAPGIVVIPIVGLLADRYGRKPLIVVGLFLFGIAGTAIAFTTDFRVVLGLRFLQGLGFAALSPVTITAIGDLYTGAREATAQGIRFTSVGIAQASVPLIAGALVVFGWHYPFFLYALAVPVGFAIWLLFEEPTSIGSDAADDSGVDPLDGQGQIRALAGLTSHPRVLAILLARQVPTFAWFALLTYNSILVVQVLGGSPGIAGTLIAASSLAKAVAATQLGRATAFFNRRVDLLLVLHVVLGLGLVVSGFATSFVWVGVGFVAIGIGLGITMSLYRSVITSFAPEHLRGGITSVSETLGQVTATIVPVVMGGAIVFLTPTVGSMTAIRWTIAGAGLFGAAVAIPALLVAIRSPAISSEQTID